MRKLTLILLCLSIFQCQTVTHQNVVLIEEINYGIFSIYPKDIVNKNTNEAFITNAKIVANTNRIPCKKDITFGIEFKIIFINTNEKIPISIRIKHPEIIRSVTNEIETEIVKDYLEWPNTIIHHSVTLNEDIDLVPGEWIFEVVNNNQILFSRIFNVVKDDD